MALSYYRRIFRAYLFSGNGQLIWHDLAERPRTHPFTQVGECYMTVADKSRYSGPHHQQGIPLLNYQGVIGLQHNPIRDRQTLLLLRPH